MANYNISGTISGGLSGVVVTAGGKSGTSSGGSYSVTTIPEGVVYVVPAKAGYKFSPEFYCLPLDGNKTNLNFTAIATGSYLYETYFHLRIKNSSGTVLATFSPATDLFARWVERGHGDLVRNEIVDINKKTDHWNIGFKQKVKATFWDVRGNKYIRGLPGYSTLEGVLNALVEGAVFEYNIIDASPAGSNWVPCEYEGADDSKPRNRNVGISLTVEFVSKDSVASSFPEA